MHSTSLQRYHGLSSCRVQKLLSLVKHTLNWKLMDRLPLPTWVHPNGRIALLGDACHPMLPYRAQGAAMAVSFQRRMAELPLIGLIRSRMLLSLGPSFLNWNTLVKLSPSFRPTRISATNGPLAHKMRLVKISVPFIMKMGLCKRREIDQ
jgi:hypothetical protein